MKRVYLCNTPYQIIIALLLSFQLTKESCDTNDMIITDNFNKSEDVIKRVRRTGVFNEVYYAKIHNILYPRTSKEKIKKCIDLFLSKRGIKKHIESNLKTTYDEIFYNNDDLFLYCLVSDLVDKNGGLKVYRFEEGYSSYINPWCSLRGKTLYKMRERILLKKCFDDVFVGLYVFEPSLLLYEPGVPVLEIKRFISDECRSLISEIFDINNFYKNLNEDWIIFEESFYQDKNYNYDIQLYEKVFCLLGKQNIAVKMHPRSVTNRFSEYGVRTLKSNGIPWEAVLISQKIENKKYIALASGSIINARLLLGEDSEAYLLYKCLKDPISSLDEQFDIFMKKYVFLRPQKSLIVPESWEAFQKLVMYR